MSEHLTVKQYRGSSSALFSSFVLRRGAAAVLALSTAWVERAVRRCSVWPALRRGARETHITSKTL